MVDSAVFLGAVIIAVTQVLKLLVPKIKDAVTIVVAALLGLVLALVDTHIGVANITIAQGILLGLASVGVHSVATRIG